LYQLHWPDRNTNYFGQLGYVHNPNEEWVNNLQEVLEVLGELVQAGKIRYVGLSNETPWGLSTFLRYAEMHGLPRVVSVQNPYNLLNRMYEVGMAEMSIREKVGLLAYSPLAFGVLSGKYLGGAMPEGARITLFERFKRYNGALSVKAAEKYVNLAHEVGISPVQMALAFINQQPFLTANIVGATKMEQLKENIDSIDITLSEEVVEKINAIHTEIPNPAP